MAEPGWRQSDILIGQEQTPRLGWLRFPYSAPETLCRDSVSKFKIPTDLHDLVVLIDSLRQ